MCTSLHISLPIVVCSRLPDLHSLDRRSDMATGVMDVEDRPCEIRGKSCALLYFYPTPKRSDTSVRNLLKRRGLDMSM